VASPQWKQDYITKFNLDHRVETRLALYALFAGLVLFAVWDWLALGAEHPYFVPILLWRFTLSVPLFAIVLWATFNRAHEWRIDWLMAILCVEVCLSVLPILWLYHHNGQILGVDALMLLVVAVYFLPNIFYQQKLFVGVTTLVAYLGYLANIDAEIHAYIHGTLYLGFLNVAGSIHSVSFDAHRLANYEKNRFLKDLAHTDQLTGAENRHKFEERFEGVLVQAEVENKGVGVAIVDIDYFKLFNDFYGHLKGDDCLIKVAQTLLGMRVHENDRCVRFGGEEFILIKYDLPEARLEQWANSIIEGVRALEIPHEALGKDKHVTVSAGVIHWHVQSPLTRTQLMKSADDALYQAKDQGRNRWVLYQGQKKASG